MLDRESTFADPAIIKLLQTQFIPVAIDQAYQRRQQDAEGEYYRQIASQGPRHDFKNGTTQGLYVATADGRFLAYTNNRGPDRVKQTLEKALAQFKPVKTAAIDKGKLDERWHPQPPPGGLIVRVRAKVLDGYEATDDQWRQIFQSSLSRDNLWISKSEHQDLVNGKVADSLARRIAKYHLIDNTRGEPPMWNDDEVRSVNLQLKDGKLTGQVHLETKSGDRGYDAQLFGVVETTDGQVTRFDVVAKGDFWGEGTYTRGAPKGKFPLGISFTLADGSDTADQIPPQASRGWLRGYIQ